MTVILSDHARAQSFVERVQYTLQDGNVDEAQHMVEERLGQDSNDVDALMLRGNIVYYTFHHASSNRVVPERTKDESIYETSVGRLGGGIETIPAEVADEIAWWWHKALAIDSLRVDIQEGMCYVYAMALNKDVVSRELRQLYRIAGNDPEMVYTMGDYARIFNDRGRFQECLEVYGTILQLYPDQAGIRSDVAALCFHHGDLPSAVRYFDEALQKGNPDRLVYANVALISTILGDDEKALNAIRRRSQLEGQPDSSLFEGLLLYSRGDAGWRPPLEAYLRAPNADTSLVPFVRFLLSDANKGDLKSYLASLDYSPSTPFIFLLHRRAVREFPKQFEPLFNYAELLTYYRRYDEAARLFAEIESKKLAKTPKQREDFSFYSAWTLQQLGKPEEADGKWKGVLESDDFFRKSAGAYFLGKNAINGGKTKAGMQFFRLVADRPSESKYAMFSQQELAKQREPSK